uniref:Uncharacterized protein n=1 Tax=Tanacetum cinerariifolium TaxID=118510 RepID=A0A6L2KG45_TANCI|nr:hypothetical protein [Tanacetum cinerariifolium]
MQVEDDGVLGTYEFRHLFVDDWLAVSVGSMDCCLRHDKYRGYKRHSLYLMILSPNGFPYLSEEDRTNGLVCSRM